MKFKIEELWKLVSSKDKESTPMLEENIKMLTSPNN